MERTAATPAGETSRPKGAGREGVVFNIMRYSVQDGPGVRTTVFLKGCPLSCRWCHNPESQAPGTEMVFRPRRCLGCGDCAAVCPQGALALRDGNFVHHRELCLACGDCAAVCPTEAREAVGRVMTVGQVMEAVKKDRAFYEESGGGVTFSGGEPLGRIDFLARLLAACREEDIPTAVDTSGAAPYEAFERINPLVDLYLYDLKVMDEQRHRRETGASNRVILNNLRRLALAGQKLIIRTPVLPGVNDDPANIDALGEFASRLPQKPPIQLLPYHETGADKYNALGRSYDMPGVDPLAGKHLERIAFRLRRFGLQATVGAM